MSQQTIDTENLVFSIDSAPDKLRARIGEYYSVVVPVGDRFVPAAPKIKLVNFSDGKIKSADISEPTVNNQVLIPAKKSTITITGEESLFRDHLQWVDFISETIVTGSQFLDHTFNISPLTVSSSFVKNFHNSEYEDMTKIYDSNQLLNFNILSYTHKDKIKEIRNIGEIRTQFDNNEVNLKVDTLMSQFPNRISNYTGSIQEITTKQRHIFHLDRNATPALINDFPFYYKKSLSRNPRPYFLSNDVVSIISRNKKEKNMFQMIKRDLSFSNRSFNIDGTNTVAKIYNATKLLTSTSVNNFSESSNELFLLEEEDINYSNNSERFINQINTIKFLSEMRNFMVNNYREIRDVFDNHNCKTFLLGYKIEKYIDNDATLPIQTYYLTNNMFHDTQLKYGRKYIYKTKALVGVLGNSYTYENLRVSREENDTEAPVSDKYWALVDVSVTPSFQILEYEIDYDETIFKDIPSPMPHVVAYGNKSLPNAHFLFHPNTATTDSQTLSLKYFTGTYEIYRLESPPQIKKDFTTGFLTSVDESVSVGNLKKLIPIETMNSFQATFIDKLIPNKKYYYSFRSISYHGTPSDFTVPIEIEIQRDSDEYKIVTKEYRYPETRSHVFKKKAKRLIKIAPNIERLSYSTEEDRNNWSLDDGELVSKSTGGHKTFKIRVTSKHTGKKIDLNITFKLNQDDTFNSEIN